MSAIKTLKIPIKIKYFLRTPPKFPTSPKKSKETKAIPNLLTEGEDEIDPVVKALRDEQIGRNLFLLGAPLLAGILAFRQPSSPLNRIVLVNVSIAETCILVGLLYRRVWRRISIALELTGIILMLLSIFAYISFNLPAFICWVPIMCFMVCLIPLAASTRLIFVQPNPAPENALNKV